MTLSNFLHTIPGIAEVVTIGGMVKQYQITLEPNRLRAYGYIQNFQFIKDIPWCFATHTGYSCGESFR